MSSSAILPQIPTRFLSGITQALQKNPVLQVCSYLADCLVMPCGQDTAPEQTLTSPTIFGGLDLIALLQRSFISSSPCIFSCPKSLLCYGWWHSQGSHEKHPNHLALPHYGKVLLLHCHIWRGNDITQQWRLCKDKVLLKVKSGCFMFLLFISPASHLLGIYAWSLVTVDSPSLGCL